jgi:hypothetical protein
MTNWREPENWTTWSERVIDSAVLNFDHLRSFDMRLVKEPYKDLPALEAIIRVVFDCHVVTERHTHDEVGPTYWRDAGGNCRIFNELRYKQSLQLPILISQLPHGQISLYAAKQNNYMVWRPAGAAANDPHYQVFFDMHRPKHPGNLLILYVQSAYLKTDPLRVQRERKLSFGKVCAELLGLLEKTPKGLPKKKKGKKAKAAT